MASESSAVPAHIITCCSSSHSDAALAGTGFGVLTITNNMTRSLLCTCLLPVFSICMCLGINLLICSSPCVALVSTGNPKLASCCPVQGITCTSSYSDYFSLSFHPNKFQFSPIWCWFFVVDSKVGYYFSSLRLFFVV